MTTIDNSKVSPSSGKDEDQRGTGFFNRPRFGGKSIWDWLDILAKLAVPLILGIATLLFGMQQAHLADLQHQSDQQLAQQQHKSDQQIALDQQRATILQTYIDNIQDLLLHNKLLQSGSFAPNPTNTNNYDVAILARARTLTALQGLDPLRKRVLLQFLFESNLIGGYTINCMLCSRFTSIIYLGGADLSYANLNDAGLGGVNLSGVDLHGANLSRVDLHGAELSGANLNGANLNGADLNGDYLYGANFNGANLNGADLSETHDGTLRIEANLSNARNLTQQQLNQVYSCKGAILPPGLICHNN